MVLLDTDPTQHIIDWLKTRPRSYHVTRQIEYYVWLQTGIWGHQ